MPDESTSSAAALTREDVAHLARLARIEATDDELDRLSGQLGVILDAVARVGEVAADSGEDVPPMSHPLPLTNVTRPDVPVDGLTSEQALAAAPASEQQRFRVPRILEED